MTLKTLKDLHVINAAVGYEDEGSEWVNLKKLKTEAVKWVKEVEDDDKLDILGFGKLNFLIFFLALNFRGIKLVSTSSKFFKRPLLASPMAE